MHNNNYMVRTLGTELNNNKQHRLTNTDLVWRIGQGFPHSHTVPS